MANDSRTYYVICSDNCKFEGMTKEQIYAAIEEATGNVPTGVDDAFITKWKEGNASGTVELWVGTEAQFNAISPAPTVKPFQLRRNTSTGKWYAITDLEPWQPRVVTISLPTASWYRYTTSLPYSQDVTISGITTNSKVDLQASATTIQQLAEDGCLGLSVSNNNGTVYVYAAGEKPTTDLTIQATIYEVTTS